MNVSHLWLRLIVSFTLHCADGKAYVKLAMASRKFVVAKVDGFLWSHT